MFFTGGLTKADSSAAKQYRTMKATPRVALDYSKKREKKKKKNPEEMRRGHENKKRKNCSL